jgi:hypothetical protein
MRAALSSGDRRQAATGKERRAAGANRLMLSISRMAVRRTGDNPETKEVTP